MIFFSHNHYYSYIRQKLQGQDRWVLFNDTFIKEIKQGWPQIIHDSLMSKAYPTVLVYEQKSSDEPELLPLMLDDK